MSRLSILICPLLLCLACAAPNEQTTRSQGDKARGSSAVGDFSLQDAKGNEHNLSDYRGKVVALSFWATWCEPCQMELPKLQEIWTRLQPKGFELLTVSVDSSDQQAEVKRLIHRYRYKFPVLLDQETEVADRFNPTMDLPYLVLLDRQGSIKARHQGYHPGDEEVLEKEIVDLLAQ